MTAQMMDVYRILHGVSIPLWRRSGLSQEVLMSQQHNAEVFRTVMEEAFGKGNVAALDGLFAPDAKEHQFGMPPTVEGLKGSIISLRAAFPDLTLTVEEVVTDGDTVWGRATARGTHLGPFMGMTPSNKKFAIQVFDMCKFDNGRIVEHWGVPDRFALMAQLGALPRQGQGTQEEQAGQSRTLETHAAQSRSSR
jgi:predicted ester cyclase